jgi:hypothetical protein
MCLIAWLNLPLHLNPDAIIPFNVNDFYTCLCAVCVCVYIFHTVNMLRVTRNIYCPYIPQHYAQQSVT